MNMQGCLFENNTAEYQLLSSPEFFEDFTHFISDSEFKNNTGTGIGVSVLHGSVNIENSNITGNSIGGIEEFIAGDAMTITNTTVCSNGEFQIDFDDWIDGGGNYVEDVCLDCPADINGDGVVGVNDLIAVVDAWGSDDASADVNGDGVVEVNDLIAIIDNWGPCE
jgi:hypothetical protein